MLINFVNIFSWVCIPYILLKFADKLAHHQTPQMPQEEMPRKKSGRVCFQGSFCANVPIYSPKTGMKLCFLPSPRGPFPNQAPPLFWGGGWLVGWLVHGLRRRRRRRCFCELNIWIFLLKNSLLSPFGIEEQTLPNETCLVQNFAASLFVFFV